MKIYNLDTNRVCVEFIKPNPLLSIPIDMWMDGLKEFTGAWIQCYYVKSHTKKDRVLYTIYRDIDDIPVDSDSGTQVEAIKGKLCLYAGKMDVLSDGWDKFCCFLTRPDCETNEKGNSYREIDLRDHRNWYECHIYEDGVKVNSHRPIPIFSENVMETL
jgi:hypothetical protein